MAQGSAGRLAQQRCWAVDSTVTHLTQCTALHCTLLYCPAWTASAPATRPTVEFSPKRKSQTVVTLAAYQLVHIPRLMGTTCKKMETNGAGRHALNGCTEMVGWAPLGPPLARQAPSPPALLRLLLLLLRSLRGAALQVAAAWPQLTKAATHKCGVGEV